MNPLAPLLAATAFQALGAAWLPPAAEVTASSGAVQLTLRVYRTKIKTTEPLWYQLELKNIGREPLIVMDKVFADPHSLVTYQTYGLYLLVQNSKHERVRSSYFPQTVTADEPYLRETPETAKLREQWRKDSVPNDEIELRLVKRQRSQEQASLVERGPIAVLKPGEFITTPPYAYTAYSAITERSNPDAEPIGQFAELFNVAFRPPGRYRIRAVYDWRPRPDTKYPGPDNVLIASPWVSIESRR